MEEGLKIRVDTDIVEVTKSLSQLEGDFKDLQKTISKTTDGKELLQLNKRLSELGATITAVRNAGRVGFDDFGQKLAAIKRPAGDASQSVTDLGRVLQDLPFGFVSIQNNINPLFESFSRLIRQSGGLGGAMKALLSTLASPAGLGFAISGIGSAITIAQIGMSAWTRGFGKAGKEAKTFSDVIKELVKPIQEITSSSEGGTQGEIGRVNALVSVLKNQNETRERQKRALEELRKINKEYFGDLTLEESSIRKLTGLQNEYTQAIVKSAITKQLESEIGKVGSELFKQQREINKSIRERTDLQNELIKKNQELIKSDAARGVTTFFVDDDSNKIGSITAKIKEQTKVLQPLRNQFSALNSELNDFVSQSLDFKPLTSNTGKVKENLKKVVEYIHQGIEPIAIPLSVIEDKKKLGIEVKEIFHGIQETIAESFGGGTIFGEKAIEGYRNFKKYWEDQAKSNPLYIESPKIKVEAIAGRYEQFFTPKMKADIKNSQAALKDIQDNALSISSAIQAGFQDTLSSIAEGIGNVLGDVANGLGSFKSVGVALSNMLVNVGKAAIGTGIAIEAIKKALESLGGAGAIAAGVALIALGTFVRSKLSEQAAGMALGGIVPPGYPNDSFPARLSSNEAVIPLERLDSIMGNRNTVSGPMVARLVGAGPDLVLYLEQQRRSTGR